MALAILSGHSATGQVVSLLNDLDFASLPDFTMPRDTAPKAHQSPHAPYQLAYQPNSAPHMGMGATQPLSVSASGYAPPNQSQPAQQQQQQQQSNHASPMGSPQTQKQSIERGTSQQSSPSVSTQSSGQPSQQQQPSAQGTAAQQSPNQSQPPPAAPKKKHVCPTCDRAFTTSGHLARHTRVHTGERNHKCPFPGCETRCSRQDNLQQHYRIHLSPGSRRSNSSATRAALQRAMSGGATQNQSMAAPPPPNAPPPLAHAHSGVGSAPPSLSHAHVYPSSADHAHSHSSRSSAERSPDIRYSNGGSSYAHSPPHTAYGTSASSTSTATNGHPHSPGHSASSSPVQQSGGSSSGSNGSGLGTVYTAHGQTAYTFAPQSQVPMMAGHSTNSTVYASPYAASSYHHFQHQQQHQQLQQQQQKLNRTSSQSSHRSHHSHSHSVPSSSGSPSPATVSRELQSPPMTAHNSIDQGGNVYPYGGTSGSPSSTSSTPGGGGGGGHHHSSFLPPTTNGAGSAYGGFQLQSPPSLHGSVQHHQQPNGVGSGVNNGSRYTSSPPPVLAPIRKELHGNPYPQVQKFST